MKIDRSRVRKTTSDIPVECQQLIDRLQHCSRAELLEHLSKISTWTFGKCELLHWAGVLDVFDQILGEAADRNEDNKWSLYCDTKYYPTEKKLLLWILHFTTLLIEHSFSRHLYNSMEHLLILLECNDMSVVNGVLNLLYMFSKRSNFITRLKTDEKSSLITRLTHIGESWGGKDNGFGLADCCNSLKQIPHSSTTLHVEFHREEQDTKNGKPAPNIIHIEHVDKIHKTPAEIMKSLVSMYYVPGDKKMWLFTHVRLAHHFSDYENRLLCVQARLQALSVLVYSNAIQESSHTLLYNGLLEELVELVEMQQPHLVEIRAAALRTLTAIIHLDRNPHIPKKPGSRLNSIIDVTGAGQYHGFLPILVRNCIASLTNQKSDLKLSALPEDPASRLPRKFRSSSSDSNSRDSNHSVENKSDIPLALNCIDLTNMFPSPLATALFSFLYHLASYEAGGEALVSSGMMESLLQVINWHGVDVEQITFVTRAVRVIDLITNIDMQAFHTHGGLQSFINRLNVEVEMCEKDQLYDIKYIVTEQNEDAAAGPSTSAEPEADELMSTEPSSTDSTLTEPPSAEPEESMQNVELEFNPANQGKSCLPQRAALLKSMLNFLKKALQDTTFSENIRHIMEGTLPESLKNIIANAEYYGPSLFLLATDVVTVYVYQEPTLLSSLQANGLTNVIMHSLLVKEVPATREVIGSLPNVFGALCLNGIGLETFIKMKPFEKLFRVLLLPTYLAAMRRRRSSEPLADTASNLGNAMDELMRHQPTLKPLAIQALIKLLEDLVQLGTDTKYVCWRPHSKAEASPSSNLRSNPNTEGSSDEEDDDEEDASTSSQNPQNETVADANSERVPVALIDYILNIMKLLDSILSNNSTDDHCREFVNQGGLRPLLRILGLSNLPVDCPITNTAQNVATVCKSILNLAHEPKLFKEGLTQLGEVLKKLKPLYTKSDSPGGSKLLLELASATNIETAFSTGSSTPLLHSMSAAHGYVIMFVHVCRTGQSEIRSLSLQHWGSDDGLKVLKGLADLYTSLVWESTLLLAYCSDDLIPSDGDFTREDIEKLNAFFDKCEGKTTAMTSADSAGNVASAMEALSTNPPSTSSTSMEVDSEIPSTSSARPPSHNLKYIKPLLGASSRLGRALAELFGLLVKLSVGSPIRQRRGQNIVAAPPLPTPFARNVATALCVLLSEGLDCDKLPPCPTPKCRITFLICSVGFTSPMLFDEKRYPYHLMLKEFVTLGGQDTFFKTFKWAISAGGTLCLEKGIESSRMPEGTGGFLDAWLVLLEKMVNPKAILESPHVISNRSSTQNSFRGYSFDPLQYLIQIHKKAFEAIMLLWGKEPLEIYGVRMTDSMLMILKHILRGEKIIKERLKSDETRTEPAAASAGTSATAPREADVNLDNLRQLMDMGFSRELALEALAHTVSVEQATDYLLSNPPHFSRGSQSGMDVDMEDDQVMQAIAISLGHDKAKETQDDMTPLSESLIDDFTNTALDHAVKLLVNIPESVHRVCDLLVTIMKRNGRVFRDNLLDTLVNEIYVSGEKVMRSCIELDVTSNRNTVYHYILESKFSVRFTHFTHLYILFLEVPSYFEMKVPCALAVHKAKLLDLLFQILVCVELMLDMIKARGEPKWLTRIILLIDAMSKIAICTERKRKMHLATSRSWKWFDLVTGKWTPYSTSNNKLINDAYWNGEQNIRVTCGRRRYTVTFSSMVQMNDESGNNRPICMTPLNALHPSITDVTVEPADTPECELTEKEDRRCVIVPNLHKKQEIDLIRVCVRLLYSTKDRDLIHSIMQTCVRLTRDYELAKIFVQQRGIKFLLNARQSSDFGNLSTLATILIRHAIEERNVLIYSMEKVLRQRTLSTIPPPYKELIYLARQFVGALARAPELFHEVSKNILRVDTSIYRGDEVDSRLSMRTEPPDRLRAQPLREMASEEVVIDLLNALLAYINNDCAKSSVATMTETPAPVPSTSNAPAEDDDVIIIDDTHIAPPSDFSSETDNPEPMQKKALLPKAIILKILAESVVSYGPIAKYIVDYIYKAGTAPHLKENTSVIAFILDKILPEAPGISDAECSTMSRMLIAALSSANHSPEAQFTLVAEVKAALGRALALPESSEKHSQVQNICSIISTMIENCPSVQNRTKTQQPPGQLNNIVKLMTRRGLFSDLARVAHMLDMSSPNFPFTINAALKPLEAISRLVNQPVPNHNQSKSKKNQQPSGDENQGSQSGATSTEGTNAQLEETIEDTENTDRDISAVASSLENNPVRSGTDRVLEEIMGQLLDSSNDNNQSFGDVVSNVPAMEIDEDGNIGYDHERDATEELMSTDSGESDSNPSDQVEDEENDDNEADDENNADNDDNNYDDDEDNDRRRTSNVDRDEDILMIQYTDHGADNHENVALPRMVRWNENGFIPLFDESNNSTDQSNTVVHPLLISRNNSDGSTGNIARTQRANRARRYQYLFNPRNPTPPVILQRLLGPHDPQLTLGANNILGGSQEMRESTRVVVMDNFGLLPSHEEQIDFVDQSGYLFGPSLAATLNHVPPVLNWWNQEAKALDIESVYDCCIYVCNSLIPNLIKYRNEELLEKKKSKEEEDKAKRRKQKLSRQDDTTDDPVLINYLDDSSTHAQPSTESNTRETDEDLDGVPIRGIDPDDIDSMPLEIDLSNDQSESSNPNDILPLPVQLSPQDMFSLGNLRRFQEASTNNPEENRNEQQVTQPNFPSFSPSGTERTPDEPQQTHASSYEHINQFDMGLLDSFVRSPRSSNIMFTRPMGLLAGPPPIAERDPEEIDDNEPMRINTSVFFDANEHFHGGSIEETSAHSNPERHEQLSTASSVGVQGASSSAPEQQIITISSDSTSSSDVVMIEPGPSSLERRDDIPEGVDPSFLEALPPEMRREVLETHRILNLNERIASTSSNAQDPNNAGVSTEVSPEFLAALPPSLQEEVLTQQRLEQQRQAAARANPNEPVDAGAFFETLQPSLRTMILSDMEDSQMSALPPDLAAEAQTLRRDWEARNRQMVQERFLQSNLTTIIRHSTRGRLSSRPSSFLTHRTQWSTWINHPMSPNSNLKIRGKQLLDHEGLSCLLVLLFSDDQHLNKLRLHRLIRNLCYHGPTREWVVRALVSIIDKSVHVKPDENLNKPARKMPKPGPLSSKLMTDSKLLQNGGNWLNIHVEAALGCSANVFIINKISGKRSDRSGSVNISIHPQAAPVVCRNALDLFISLSKAFPACLLPLKTRDERDEKNCLPPVRVKGEATNFWEMLLKLDCTNRKGKSLAKNSNPNLQGDSDSSPVTFEQSAFGQLLNMLSSPIITRNMQLTDSLLKLLSVITSGMPELTKPQNQKSRGSKIMKNPDTNIVAPAAALSLAVNVLTHKSCSEEGLEHITNLLLNLSASSVEMSYMILNLLLNGAVRIGEIVRGQIRGMLQDLKDHDLIQAKNVEEGGPSTSKGTITDRFTKESVVITASTKVKTSCELQLPSMVPLTSKSSSQVFFFRVLKVVGQIRNAIKQIIKKGESPFVNDLPALCDQLCSLDSLWNTLSQCLLELEHTPDHHAVLVLQPAVEAFFLVYSPQQGPVRIKDIEAETATSAQSTESQTRTEASNASQNSQPDLLVNFDDSDSHSDSGSKVTVPPDQIKFLIFAEKHKTVLNQILRQSTVHLADGSFAVLVDHTRILDFDIKRRYFRIELERLDQGMRREETAVHVRRSHIFEDSFRELYRRPHDDWKNRLYIVFEDEEGQDAGGLLREWYVIISRDIFNPNYALFTVSPGDRVTYMINSASHYNTNHLCYFKFVGRVIAKAIYDNKLLECYFTRSFYKHILGIPVKYTDMESEDYTFYRGLVYLMENNINNMELDLTFSTEINEFGVTETRDLIPNGRNVPVAEENKMEYIRLVCQMKMTGAIKQQLNAFLEGFYDIIPKRLISIFNEQELELLISGLPNVDIDDLKGNTEYHKYQANSLQIQWFWRALRSFDQADRAKFLQFVTGTSKVPLQGFGALEGMNGVQKFQIHRDDRSTDRLPSAHTCFNQLDLPVYETYDKLRSYLLKAIHECSEGFGFA